MHIKGALAGESFNLSRNWLIPGRAVPSGASGPRAGASDTETRNCGLQAGTSWKGHHSGWTLAVALTLEHIKTSPKHLSVTQASTSTTQCQMPKEVISRVSPNSLQSRNWEPQVLAANWPLEVVSSIPSPPRGPHHFSGALLMLQPMTLSPSLPAEATRGLALDLHFSPTLVSTVSPLRSTWL